MQIWVDADACPAVIKETLYRAAQRVPLQLTLVANQMLRTPPSKWIRCVQVAQGFDVADDWIVAHAASGDVVITADIPLAAQVVEKGALALNPRGELYDVNTVAQALRMRDLMDQLRGAGVETGGPAPFSAADSHAFARSLDRLLAQHNKSNPE